MNKLGLFFYIYWPFLLIGTTLLSTGGVIGHKKYKKSNITQKINLLNKEEKEIKSLIFSCQKKYLKEKIGAKEYHKTNIEGGSKLIHIKKERLKLRRQRRNLLDRKKVLLELEHEKLQIDSEIKNLHKEYYIKKTLKEQEFHSNFKMLKEMLAEVEEENISLNLLKNKKPKTKRKKEKKLKKVKRNKKKIKLKINFRKNKEKLKRKIKLFWNKLKFKKEKKGVMFLDNKIIDKLKTEFGGKDCKGKYIQVKLKN
jgi:hypothetical protein